MWSEPRADAAAMKRGDRKRVFHNVKGWRCRASAAPHGLSTGRTPEGYVSGYGAERAETMAVRRTTTDSFPMTAVFMTRHSSRTRLPQARLGTCREAADGFTGDGDGVGPKKLVDSGRARSIIAALRDKDRAAQRSPRDARAWADLSFKRHPSSMTPPRRWPRSGQRPRGSSSGGRSREHTAGPQYGRVHHSARVYPWEVRGMPPKHVHNRTPYRRARSIDTSGRVADLGVTFKA